MSVVLHLNGRQASAELGSSLFDCAESMGVRVPTSCRKQGKCKECLVEIAGVSQYLSAKTAAEGHLKENFRLSCCAKIAANSGVIRCHTMRRGDMRIERHALSLPEHNGMLRFD